MLKVGVTGGLGSGKTVVCSILKQLGVPVFNADEEAKKLLDREDIRSKILLYFGEQVFDCDRVSRKKLANYVFSNEEALARLNELVHPAVAREFLKWTAQQNASQPYVVIEAALLIESRQDYSLDMIAVVCSPLEDRIIRAMQRDNATRESIMARISKQLSDEDMIKKAGCVLLNDDDHMLLPQVLEMDKKLRKDHEG